MARPDFRTAIREALEEGERDWTEEDLDAAVQRMEQLFEAQSPQLSQTDLEAIATHVADKLPPMPTGLRTQTTSYLIGVASGISANNLVGLISYLQGFLGFGMAVDGDAPADPAQKDIRALFVAAADWVDLREVEQSAHGIHDRHFLPYERAAVDDISRSDVVAALRDLHPGVSRHPDFFGRMIFTDLLGEIIQEKRARLVAQTRDAAPR